MNAPIRILLVSDSPALESSVSDQLLTSGISGVFYRASTEAEYVRFLKVGVDVVIAEERQAADDVDFDTTKALTLMGERDLDVSFLIVTEAVDTEVVVEYMRQGAADVIFGQRLWRLGPAVSRALADREGRYARRRAEAAQRYSETRFRTISGLISDFAYALRVIERDILAWEWMTEMTDRISGLQLQDLPDQGGWHDLAHPEDRPILDRHYATLCAGGASEIEFRIITRDGDIRYLRDHCQTVSDDLGPLIFGAVRDITEFRKAGQALRRSEERFRQLFEHAADAVFVNDCQGRYLDANELAVELLGYSREELRQITTREINSMLTSDVMEDLWKQINSGGPATFEGFCQRKDGTTVESEIRLAAFEAAGEKVMLAIVRDISERKRTEEAIRASEERYRRIVETSSESIVVTDADGRITFGNERLFEMFGFDRDELIGQPAIDFISPESRPLVAANMANRDPLERQEYSARLKHKNGSDLWVTISATVLHGPDGRFEGRLAMITDITERKRAEEELFQAQKLESVGRLAAGIAHEINTPIQFVGDNIHFLRDSFAGLQSVALTAQALREAIDAEPPMASRRVVALDRLRVAEEDADVEYLMQEVPKAIEQTLDGVERVASIVRAMKEFAHPDATDFVAMDVNQALRSTLTVARNELKYVADVETDLDDLPPVSCQPGAINQVFLNLLINAAQAVEDRLKVEPNTRGTIQVTTRRDGDGILVAIADTGCGIPDQIKQKVFDQFFTTKSVGRGTGQGLALAHRVVTEQHGGSLSFESEVGRGTTFFVRLPLDGAVAGHEPGLLEEIA